MEILQLRHFVRVAENGSYIKAADILDVNQSTLSRQVRALEVELRTTLFYRHGRGVLLTEPGKKFLEYARAVLHTVDLAMSSVRNTESAYSGQLVIGIPPSLGRVCIPILLPQLMQRFPRAEISVHEGLSGGLYESVLLGQMDFALVYNPTFSQNVRTVPIATDSLFLIAPETIGRDSDSVTLDEAAKLPLILPHGNHSVRVALESAAARRGLAINVTLQVDSTHSIMHLVAQGVGYSIVPRIMKKTSNLPALCWQQVTDPILEYSICLVLPSQQPTNPLQAEAAEAVRATLVELLGQ